VTLTSGYYEALTLQATAGTPPYTWSIWPADRGISAFPPGTYEWYRESWIHDGDLGALALMTTVPLPQTSPEST
jgi:hypothetical protein